jgi:ribosome-associated translation inhibitor RaiA
MPDEPEFPIDVSSHGDVAPQDVERAMEKLVRMGDVVPGQILHGQLRLVMAPPPAGAQPAKVDGALDVDGRLVRAEVSAPTMQEAVDRFADRLRSRLTQFVERLHARRNAAQEAAPGQWRRGDIPSDRPQFFDRPAEDRQVVRRKTFAPAPSTPEEAVFDMEALDHDFFLFRNAASGAANVVSRASEGGYDLIQPTAGSGDPDAGPGPIRPSKQVPPRIPLRDAITALNVGNQPFVFFVDADTDDGAVVYRRYDGHYGLITLESAA